MEKTKTPYRYAQYALAALVVVLIGTLFAQSLPYRNRRQTQIVPLDFAGTIQTDADTAILPLEENALRNTRFCREVILKGSFDRPLAEGTQILFLIEYLEVHLYLNGEELYRYGSPENYPRTVRSGGMTWHHVVLPRGVDRDEEWTIVLRSPYSNNYYSAYWDFLNSLCTGDSGALARAVIADNGLYAVMGGSVLLVSLVFLGLCMALTVQCVWVHRSVYYFTGFAAVCGAWILLNPRYSTLLLANPILVMQLEPLALITAETLLLAYVGTFLKTAAQRVNRALLYLTVVATGFGAVLQLLGLTDGYAIRTTLTVFMGIVLLMGTGAIVHEMRQRKAEEIRFLAAPGLLLVGSGILEGVNYALELVPPGRMLFWGILIFIIAQLAVSVRYIRGAILVIQQAAELERRMVENNVAIMLSQIQPHFLYNSLSVIKGLCQTDPRRAELAVDHFADFLRGNLDSLTAAAPIAFDQELSHTRHYLELEQMRFGKRLQVVYDTPVTLFRLPSLTIQPLAENAVRYGITKRRQGGTVTISTGETDEAYTVTVTDDGLGFDTEKNTADDRPHIGIRNVRERLQAQCGGQLLLHSVPGEGTTAILVIPKER